MKKTRELIEETGAVFIPPFDDEDVIAGQGTIGMEILRQNPGPLDAVFVPIGGGGLAAGVAVYIKQLRPEVKVIGGEPVDSDDMRRSIAAGRPVEMKEVGLFADGVAVKRVGDKCFELCRECLDDIILVDTDAICGAIKDIFEDTRVVAEPAGALSLGAFCDFVKSIGKRSITEICSRFADPEQAHILVGLRIRGKDDVSKIIEGLEKDGFGVSDMSDNELAKLHIRHLVGGNAPQIVNERVFRFEFPERPGALLNFVDAMHVQFSITLFQYRYHGADFGRVLVGFDVPQSQNDAFQEYLDRVEAMGYPYVEETDNDAYRLFLGYHGKNK